MGVLSALRHFKPPTQQNWRSQFCGSTPIPQATKELFPGTVSSSKVRLLSLKDALYLNLSPRRCPFYTVTKLSESKESESEWGQMCWDPTTLPPLANWRKHLGSLHHQTGFEH